MKKAPQVSSLTHLWAWIDQIGSLHATYLRWSTCSRLVRTGSHYQPVGKRSGPYIQDVLEHAHSSEYNGHDSIARPRGHSFIMQVHGEIIGLGRTDLHSSSSSSPRTSFTVPPSSIPAYASLSAHSSSLNSVASSFSRPKAPRTSALRRTQSSTTAE